MTSKQIGTALMMLSMFLMWGLVGGIETLPPDADWQMLALMLMSVLAAVLGVLGMSLCRMDTYEVL